jgi:hypothetical protein
MNRKRPRQLVIRLTDLELKHIKAKIKESSLNQQAYIIKALSDKPIINSVVLNKLVIQISHIGNNLNQVTRKCNGGNSDILLEITKIRRELDSVWQQLNSLF